MIHIWTGIAGTGKSERLLEKIQDTLAAPKKSPVLTLIPEQFSYEFDRKLYRKLGVSRFQEVEAYSFRSLARAVFQRCGNDFDSREDADEMTKYALLYQSTLYLGARTHQLRVLEKQGTNQEFLNELERLFSQFHQHGITPVQLYNACSELNGNVCEKLLDITDIFQHYEMLLEQYHFRDTETDLTRAAEEIQSTGIFSGVTLFLDEFEIFTEEEYEMLEVLFGACKDVYITLRTDEQVQNPTSLFREVNDTFLRIQQIARQLQIPMETKQFHTTYRFQSEDLRWLSQHIYRTATPFLEQVTNLQLWEALTPNEEIDFVCTTIRRLLSADKTLHCRDIVVMTNQMDNYQTLLETEMQRYELPYYMNIKRSICYMPPMMYLLTLLALLQKKRPDTNLILRLGKTGLTSCTSEEISELENYCYTWQIEGNTWLSPFSGGDCEAEEQTRQALFLPILQLKECCATEQTGAEFCERIYHFLEEQQIPQKQSELLLSIEEEEIRLQQTADWHFAWKNWMDALDHMATLYADFPMQISEFCQILSSLLQNVKRAVPPQTLDAIFLTDGTYARLNAPKIVFLVGLSEGVFPTESTRNAIFSERDCQTLEENKISVQKPRELQIAQGKLSAYAQMSAASDALYMTYPYLDLMQQRCYPSRVFAQIKRLFPEIPIQSCNALDCTYYATTYQTAYYQYVQQYHRHDPNIKVLEDILKREPLYREKIDALQRQRTIKQEETLYQIQDRALMKRNIGKRLALSASSLERYQTCPFSYFCQDVLRLYRRKRMKLAGAENGTLVHYCLEKILQSYDRDAFLSLTPETIHQVVEMYAEKYWETELGGDFSKSGRECAAFAQATDDICDVVAHLQEEFRQSEFLPVYFELRISESNRDFPPIELTTKNGKVCIIGTIDRVDICEDDDKQWVRVIDYKTGTKNFRLGNLYYGLDMQMLLYLFTITNSGAKFENAAPAGVLYMPAGKITSEVDRSQNTNSKNLRNKSYLMNGILLKDPNVIQLMEKEAQGVYIPAKCDATGAIQSLGTSKKGVFVSPEQMSQLRTYVEQQLQKTAEKIYDGEIDARPLKLNETPCDYCAFSGVCGNRFEKHHQETIKDPEKEVLRQLDEISSKGEQDHGLSMDGIPDESN